MERFLTVNGVSYEIEKLLGHGKGGYSYLVRKDGSAYVLKQIHHEPCSYYTFGNKIEAERNDYERLQNAGIRIPVMLDIDMQNERILKEYIPGDTIDRYVLEDRMEDGFYWQIEDMCRLLYPANTNIDYFPTNFVVCGGRLYYVDYECNDYMEQWNYENWGSQYWWKSQAFLERFHK